ncbi:MAG: hypothetical protein ACKOEX_07930 [Planctomycetia bacterium]
MTIVRGRRLVVGLMAMACAAALAGAAAQAGQPQSRVGDPKPLSHGTPQNQAPWRWGRSPYVTGHRQRPKYFVPPTDPRTPTWNMYGTPPGVVPGDWPRYAPLGFGGYRFPAVGSQAYR